MSQVATKTVLSDDDFFRARQNMVDGQVRTNKATNTKLIAALREIPREMFVRPDQRGIAYIDEDIAIAPNRFLVEPMVFARLVQEAGIKETDRILDIGCASGYSTAVLAKLAAHVTGIEENPTLARMAVENFTALGIDNVKIVVAPMMLAHPVSVPYDVIIVNGALDAIPRTLAAQLKDGGKLLMVLRPKTDPALQMMGKAMIYEKMNGQISGRALFDAGTPYIALINTEQKFVF
jgi:protein-L-isoaspartate(D-aspartate) O-methyltransferase